MSLITVIGDRSLNSKLLLYASRHIPSLIIDCANAANPHSIFPDVPIERMNQIYVIELELLYKFRDVLLRLPSMINKLGLRCTIVTTSDGLFNYQDEIENNDIIEHSWELMRQIGSKKTIIVGVSYGSIHEKFAKKYSHRIGVIKDGAYCAKSTKDGR
jgi:hypothetical protein